MPADGTITLSTGTLGAPSTMTVQVSKDTIIRRYAPDSIKFDDAKPGTLDQIKAGDQLRARGTKSEDGKELAAAEIVSGTFPQHSRNGHLQPTLQQHNHRDRSCQQAARNAEDRSRFADASAARDVRAANRHAPEGRSRREPAVKASRGNKAVAAADASASAADESRQAREAMVERAPGGAPDFQQMLNRMPAVSLSELHKGAP